MSILLLVGMLITSLTTVGLAFDASRSINVISREAGSGTRGAFVELMGIEVKTETEKSTAQLLKPLLPTAPMLFSLL